MRCLLAALGGVACLAAAPQSEMIDVPVRQQWKCDHRGYACCTLTDGSCGGDPQCACSAAPSCAALGTPAPICSLSTFSVAAAVQQVALFYGTWLSQGLLGDRSTDTDNFQLENAVVASLGEAGLKANQWSLRDGDYATWVRGHIQSGLPVVMGVYAVGGGQPVQLQAVTVVGFHAASRRPGTASAIALYANTGFDQHPRAISRVHNRTGCAAAYASSTAVQYCIPMEMSADIFGQAVLSPFNISVTQPPSAPLASLAAPPSPEQTAAAAAAAAARVGTSMMRPLVTLPEPGEPNWSIEGKHGDVWAVRVAAEGLDRYTQYVLRRYDAPTGSVAAALAGNVSASETFVPDPDGSWVGNASLPVAQVLSSSGYVFRIHITEDQPFIPKPGQTITEQVYRILIYLAVGDVIVLTCFAIGYCILQRAKAKQKRMAAEVAAAKAGNAKSPLPFETPNFAPGFIQTPHSSPPQKGGSGGPNAMGSNGAARPTRV